jgi:hypothetical protein
MGKWVCGYGFYDLVPIPAQANGYDIFLFTNLWVIFYLIPVLLLGFYLTVHGSLVPTVIPSGVVPRGSVS